MPGEANNEFTFNSGGLLAFICSGRLLDCLPLSCAMPPEHNVNHVDAVKTSHRRQSTNHTYSVANTHTYTHTLTHKQQINKSVVSHVVYSMMKWFGGPRWKKERNLKSQIA